MAACACADFALTPSCRDDIQVSLFAIVRENAFKPARYMPIRLTFAMLCMNHPCRRSHAEAYLGGADPQQCALAMPWARINTTIQLSFAVICLLLVTLAGYCEGFKYQRSHLTLLSFTCNVQSLGDIGVVSHHRNCISPRSPDAGLMRETSCAPLVTVKVYSKYVGTPEHRIFILPAVEREVSVCQLPLHPFPYCMAVPD